MATVVSVPQMIAAPGSFLPELNNSVYHHRWFPIKPSGKHTNTVNLQSGQSIICEVPGRSALKITGDPSCEFVSVTRLYYLNTPEGLTKASIPVDNAQVYKNSIEIPTHQGRGEAFQVKVLQNDIKLSFYRLVRIKKDYYWEQLAADIKQFLKKHEYNLESLNITDTGFLTDNWFLKSQINYICRQLQITGSDVDPLYSGKVFTDNLLYEILMSGRLLYKEGTYSNDIYLSDHHLDVRGETGSIISDSTKIELQGPGLLDLDFRLKLPDDTDENHFDVSLDIRVDGFALNSPIYSFDIGSSGNRWIQSSVSDKFSFNPNDEEILFSSVNKYSLLVSKKVYIPSGYHIFSIKTDRKIWVNTDYIRPVHSWHFWSASEYWLPFPPLANKELDSVFKNIFCNLINLGISCIPKEDLNDFGWLPVQNILNQDDQLIADLCQESKNKLTREPIRPETPGKIFFNPVFSISSLKPMGKSNFSKRSLYYSLPPDQECLIEVGPEEADRFVPVTFVNTEKHDLKSPISIRVDGRERLIKESMNPSKSNQVFTIGMRQGLHQVTVNAGDNAILCKQPVNGQSGKAGRLCIYYPTNKGDPLSIICNGGGSGRKMRVLWRFDGQPKKSETVWCQWDDNIAIPVEVNQLTGGKVFGFYLRVPPGENQLKIWSGSAGWLNFSLLKKREEAILECLEYDQEVEIINNFFTNLPDFKTGISNLQKGNTHPLVKILTVAQLKDIKTALDMYADSNPVEYLLSSELVRCFLLKLSGHSNSALQLGTKIFKQTDYREKWFIELLMSAAIASNKPIAAWQWVEELLADSPDHVDALSSKIRLLIHFAEINAAEKALIDLLEKYPDNKEFRKLRVVLENIDPGQASFSDDWPCFSLNPVFVCLKDSDIQNDCEPVLLTDRLLQMNKSDETGWSGSKYYPLDMGHTVGLNVDGPTILRLTARPNHLASTKNNIEAQSDFLIGYRSKSLDVQFDFSSKTSARQNLYYDGIEQIRPGNAERIDIPIAEGEGSIEIVCLSGAGTLKFQVQVPGIEDNPRKDLTVGLAERIKEVISCSGNSSDGEEPSFRRSLALFESVLEEYPECKSFDSIRLYLEKKLHWKTIQGYSTLGQSAKVQFTQIPHDPIIQVRNALIKDPFPGLTSYSLVSEGQLKFELPENPDGIILAKTAGYPETHEPFKVDIYSGNLFLGGMDGMNREWNIPRDKIRTDKLVFILSKSETGKPIKITTGFRSIDGVLSSLKLIRNHRYIVSKSGLPATADLIAPTFVRVQCRALQGTGNEELPVRITVKSGSGKIVRQQDVSVNLQQDPFVSSMDFSGNIGIINHYFIPLPETEIYQISVEPVVNNNARLLVRFTGAIEDIIPEKSTNKREVSFERIDPSISAKTTGYKPMEIDWESRVPESLQLKTQDGGTWSIRMIYRDRDDDNDLENPLGLYESAGYTTEVGYKRRFEGRGIFWDADLGGTLAENSSYEPVMIVRQLLGINTSYSDVRVNFGIRGYFQEIQSESEHSIYLDLDIVKTFKPSNRLYIIPVFELFSVSQSITKNEAESMEDVVDPRLFNEFDCRHDTGIALKNTIRYDPLVNVMTYLRLTGISSGDGDSGFMGPWWVRTGVKGLFGPILLGISYMHREVPDDSLDPDRSRLTGSCSLFHWSGQKIFWELSVRDRYTFETDLNDFQAALKVQFNSGRFLRDINPFRVVFKREIEELAR